MNELSATGNRIIKTAMQAADPYRLIMEQVRVKDGHLVIQGRELYRLDAFNNIYVIGMGKGTAPMAAAIEEVLKEKLTEGAVIVKYGHKEHTRIIRQYESGHPLPDENTLKWTQPIVEIADKANENDLVIVLITGGGSALLEYLPASISLTDLSEMNRQLLSCGAAIQEINTIRKHISLVKGGRLAETIWPAKSISLILSDVIGDPPESIASGPTAPDPTTFSDALDIVQKYQLSDTFPAEIIKHLRKGMRGEIPETADQHSGIFKNVHNIIIGNNRLVLEKARDLAIEAGFHTLILTDRVQGEAREIARFIAGILNNCALTAFPVAKPAAVFMGGEPTVTLHGDGLGGRNQELVLAALTELSGTPGSYYLCSVGTDGTDGPTDAAGAWIDHDTPAAMEKQHLSILPYLNNNDAYHFFEKLGQLVKTGPTRTNVMDLICILVR